MTAAGHTHMPPSLLGQFEREAMGLIPANHKTRNSTRLRFPVALYDTLRALHGRSLAMARQLLAVMDDPEHGFIMEFGRCANKRMPDVDAFYTDVLLYADFLEGFSFDGVQPDKREGHVSVPAAMAAAMKHMLHYNGYMLNAIRCHLQDTDYMQVFTDAKVMGLIYEGKSALAEILNLSLAGQTARSLSETALDPARWPVVREKSGDAAGPRVLH